MAVNGMRTFLLRDVRPAATWLVTALVAGTATLACGGDDPASTNESTNAGSTTNPGNTSAGTTGAATNTNGANTTNTTGAGPTGNTNAGPTNTTSGGPVTGGNNDTTTGAGGGGSTSGTTGTTGSCGLTVDSQELSEDIATVGIVTWSATGTITSAEIKFGPADAPDFTMSAPVDLNEPNYRTLLLGMKPDSDYKFQVVAMADGTSCSSDTLMLSTGSAPNDVSVVETDIAQPENVAPGFYVTVDYAINKYAFIFDGDGDPVWWAKAPNNASGVRMDYEGKAVWIVTGNPSASGQGQIRRVSMDGSQVDNLPSSYDAHHDLAPLPGGSVAALIHSGSNCASIIEVQPDMSVTDIVADVSTIYTPAMQCHPNAILYHPEDESFTVSDRNPNVYVKITKTGMVQWQLGGTNDPPDREPAIPHIEKSWNVNHGHHLLPDGNFLFFNNNASGGGGGGIVSAAVEYSLDLDALTATDAWSYTTDKLSNSLGDVQRLENGNTLITISNAGTVYEVDQGGTIVQTLQTGPLGYLMHRKSLYGPPPK